MGVSYFEMLPDGCNKNMTCFFDEESVNTPAKYPESLPASTSEDEAPGTVTS